MRKVTSFLMLLVAFVLTGASASAQTSGYKPGVRKTSFAVGDQMFIYNTAINGDQDRTGFYRYNSASSTVQLVKQKPFSSSSNYRYDVNGTSIWTIASVENVGTAEAPVYKMSIKNSADQYLTFNMGYSSDVQYVYVRSWGNTASNKRAGVKSETADGTTIANADITDSYIVWTVSQNENTDSGDFWNGNIESVVKWSSAHPFAFYTTVAMTEEELASVRSALATTKTSIVSGIQTVLTDCGVSVTVAPITLTETNTTSNAEENAGGGYSDGDGIRGLIDKTDGQPNLNTYFHSRWNGTVVNEHHYIQVDAGEALSAFVFGYSTRNRGEQHPTAFDIFGSTDGSTWTKIAEIDKETFALKGTYQGATETYGPRGFVLPGGTTYRYFRFAVTANTSGGKYGGYPYFALADFNFSKVTFSCNDSYAQNASILLNNYLLKQEVEAMLANVADPESAVLTTARNMVANQFAADASKQTTFPFTLTTEAGSKHNYFITTRSGMYYSLRPWESGKIYLDASSETAGNNAYRYWFFTRSEMTGAIYIHPVTAPIEMVGYSDTNDGNTRIFINNTVTNRKFRYVQSGNNKGFRPFSVDTYVSNHGGSTNAMGFYNDANDGGTKVEFTAAGALPDNIVDLSAKFMTLRSSFSTLPDASLIGTELNQYNQSQVGKFNSAESMLKTQAGSLTTESIANYLAGATFTALEMNKPAPNGFYRFLNVGSGKYLTTTLNNNATDNRMNMVEGRTSAAIFYLTSDNKLVGYDNGLYTQNFSGDGNYGFQAVGGTGFAVSFPNGNTYTETSACYRINCGSRSIYGKNATLDAGGTQAASNTDTGYDWTIEAVTALPLTIGQVGWSTFYAPVPVTIPNGVTAYIAGIDGNICTLTEVTGTVPANTGLILYKQDGGNVEMAIAESGSTDVTGNALVGGTNTVNPETGYTYYALQRKRGDDTKVGLYQYAGELKGFRAFYRAASSSPEANVAGFSFDTIITGIDGILGTDGTNDGTIYDLSGRRLNKPVKGLNIIGGKKVIVK